MNNINKRLKKVASMIEPCRTVADIGCDHAYLAIYLIENKIAKKVYACDINQGPLETAEKNIKENGLPDKIETVLTDGLCGVDEKEPDTVVICGMGGELISTILEKSCFVKEKSPLLLLQPMTKADILRKHLIDNSFEIIEEATVFDSKIYQIIKTRYNENAISEYNEAQMLIGKQKGAGDEYYIPLAEEKLVSIKTALAGIKSAGRESPTKELQIKQLEEIINESNTTLHRA